MIRLTEQEIDTARVLRDAKSPEAGAVVLFLGTARRSTGGKVTEALDYECYPEMAEKKLAELEDEARGRWALEECVIVHRLGRLKIGEVSVAIAVSSAHRQAAFEAGRWLTYRAAWLKDQGMPCSLEASYCKLYTTEMAKKVTQDGMQVMGGYGYMMEYDMQRYVRDALLGTIGGGTNQIQRLIIGKLLGCF